MAGENALRDAGIDRDEVLAAALAAFARDKRRSRIFGLDSVALVLGREYGVHLEPSVKVLALHDQVYQTAYQLDVRGGGQLTLVRLKLPRRKRIILAHLSEKPDRKATPDHAAVAGALAFVDYSYSFNASNERPPTLEEGGEAASKRDH
jgi:hypothetical protein